MICVFQIIPSVEGIYFKDLKQTLKKEQCDVSLAFLSLQIFIGGFFVH